LLDIDDGFFFKPKFSPVYVVVLPCFFSQRPSQIEVFLLQIIGLFRRHQISLLSSSTSLLRDSNRREKRGFPQPPITPPPPPPPPPRRGLPGALVSLATILARFFFPIPSSTSPPPSDPFLTLFLFFVEEILPSGSLFLLSDDASNAPFGLLLPEFPDD